MMLHAVLACQASVLQPSSVFVFGMYVPPPTIQEHIASINDDIDALSPMFFSHVPELQSHPLRTWVSNIKDKASMSSLMLAMCSWIVGGGTYMPKTKTEDGWSTDA
jgi:hypothetical protein